MGAEADLSHSSAHRVAARSKTLKVLEPEIVVRTDPLGFARLGVHQRKWFAACGTGVNFVWTFLQLVEIQKLLMHTILHLAQEILLAFQSGFLSTDFLVIQAKSSNALMKPVFKNPAETFRVVR